LVVLGACSPKVLRSSKPKDGQVVVEEKDKSGEKNKSEEKPVEEKAIVFNDIALILPFQLHKVSQVPSKADVDRAALALDFYQGFKMGIDQLAVNGNNFRLNILDSRDNTVEVQRLAASKEVQQAQLIVGPVFPTEINAFSNTAKLTGKLQISPLAARSPSGYQMNNLVTVTPPIDIHAKAIADFIAKDIDTGDKVVIINNNDDDSKKFLAPLKEALNMHHVPFNEVSAMPDIEPNLAATGKNLVVAGATNPFFISPLLVELNKLKTESAYSISLIGHPNWVKLDLDRGYLMALNTCISSSFYVNDQDAATKQFIATYQSLYRVAPSEFAFKGYDTGVYFGRLLAKYPKDYARKLIDAKYRGLSIGFDFINEPNAGFVNNRITLLRISNNGFTPFR